MPTNRRPRRAAATTKIKVTDRAVELFKKMQTLPNCTCVWGPNYWNRIECASCERWWDLHSDLHAELKLKPWEWSVIAHPPGAPPHEELKDGRIVHRSMPQLAYAADWNGARELIGELMERLEAAYPDVYLDLEARYYKAEIEFLTQP
jgi:hypothetical protein